LKIRRFFYIFFDNNAAAFTSTCRNFSTMTQGIRLRRRVDVFSMTSYTMQTCVDCDFTVIDTSCLLFNQKFGFKLDVKLNVQSSLTSAHTHTHTII